MKIYWAKTIQKSDLTQFVKVFEEKFAGLKAILSDDLRIDLGSKQRELTTSSALIIEIVNFLFTQT